MQSAEKTHLGDRGVNFTSHSSRAQNISMRIHVGNIGPQLAENINELKERLEKYGQIQSSLELLTKPVLDTYFLFVDIDLDQDKFTALKRALNGVKFRQSTLSIQEAKPKWSWTPNQERNLPLNPTQNKREKSHLYEPNVYKGKMRTHPRHDLNDITLRIKYDNGRIQKVRGRSQRLWGYEKKLPQNLVYEYIDGEWRDLTGRPVEIAVRDEQYRNARVAEHVNTGYLSDSDFEEFKQQMDETGVYDEYQGNDDDMEIVGQEKATVQNTRQDYGDSETDDEFYNTQKTRPPVQQSTEAPTEPKNTTEALRDVLSAPRGTFTLFGNPDAAEEEQEPEVVQPVISAPIAPAVRKFGLFFAHADSPFLQTQAQVLKLNRNFDAEEWEKSFWENRGEWNRQLRRRRKDEQRLLRKRGINVEHRSVEL